MQVQIIQFKRDNSGVSIGVSAVEVDGNTYIYTAFVPNNQLLGMTAAQRRQTIKDALTQARNSTLTTLPADDTSMAGTIDI